jgi:hypothetical protein
MEKIIQGKEGDRLKQKYYYIPGYHRMVYCHDECDGILTFGGMTDYVNDARTNILRQNVSVNEFVAQKPKEVLLSELGEYSFLYVNPITGQYKITQGSQRSGCYFRFAERLPMLKSPIPVCP